MRVPQLWLPFWTAVFLLAALTTASALTVNFTSASTVGVTANGYTASGALTATLGFTPATGTNLTVVNNTSQNFIIGTFSNVAQGATLALSYNGVTYNFVANYYGGTGNDFVLQWEANQPLAWGYNNDGQVGNGGTTNLTVPTLVSVSGVLTAKTIVSVSVGGYHTLALCSDGTVAAWGANTYGELGNGGTSNSSTPVAVTTTGTALAGKTVTAVAAGGYHSMALCSDGTVAAWGLNYYGAVGNNNATTQSFTTAQAVNTTSGTSSLYNKTVIAIAAGTYHSVALCSDGTVSSWGYNTDGELGNNSTVQTLVPVTANTASGTSSLYNKTVTAISAGSLHTLALCSDGTVSAWGSNSYGQLGTNNSSQTTSSVPVAVNTASGVSALYGHTVVAIAAGGYHSMALSTGSTPLLVAWGQGSYGQLGNNNSMGNALAPVTVDVSSTDGSSLAGKTVAAISAGFQNSLALCTDGSLSAWGNNVYGELGNTTTNNSSLPVAVSTGSLSAGVPFVLAVAGSSGGHCVALAASPSGPQIQVQQPAGTTLANGSSTVNFGSTLVGAPLTETFIINNLNATNALTITSVTTSGTNSGDFVVTTTPASSVAASGSTTFVVTFTPGATGTRTATLQIGSDDPVNATYNITLTGSGSGTLGASYTTGKEIPLSVNSFTASSYGVSFTLNYAPTPGTVLMVVQNTGLGFINGAFSNLRQGQLVNLTYSSTSYNFAANYYGGPNGRDLVLQWASTSPYAWGSNATGQLGNNSTTSSDLPVAVNAAGVLAGQTLFSMAAGGSHSLALCSNGTVAAWGANSHGQLGNNGASESNVPVAVSATPFAGRLVVALAAGGAHSLALCSDGTVWAWGANAAGQLGNSSTTDSPIPVQVNNTGVLSGQIVVAIAAGQNHSLALCANGTVVAWGANSNGQLGNGNTTNSSTPVAVTTGSGPLSGQQVQAIAAGANHALALTTSGTLVSWGANSNGQLGTGNTTDSNVPVAVSGTGALSGATISAIAAGQNHSLALSEAGAVIGWGANGNGQLGNGSTSTSVLTPVAEVTTGALSGQTVNVIAAGELHSIAYCASGVIVAWGYNTDGELGNGSTTQSSSPVTVSTTSLPSGDHFMAGATGQSSLQTLAIVAAAQVPVISVQQPAGTPLVNGSSTVNFGGNLVGYGVTQTFTIANSGFASLTLSSTTFGGTDPDDFAVTTAASTTVAQGSSTTFVVTFTPKASGSRTATMTIASNDPTNGTFVVNLSGTGNSTLNASYTTGQETPVSASSFTATGISVDFSLNYAPATGTRLTVVNNTGIAFISGAFSNLAQGQAVALTYNGNTYNFVANYYGGSGNDLVLEWAGVRPVAWGNNSRGQLGGGSNSSTPNATPQPITTASGGLSGQTVLSMAAGANHSLAVCANGTVAAWGSNSNGQLGNGNTTDSYTPVTVSGALASKTVVAVAAGQLHTLALCSDGTVYAWGGNAYGQLGNGGTTDSNIPVAVLTTGILSGRKVVAIAAGDNHSLALCSDGTLAAWGNNANGQLGNNSTTNSSSPVVVNTSSGVSALYSKSVIGIAAGGEHCEVWCADGTLAAWGWNGTGQLGNGGTTSSSVPVSLGTATPVNTGESAGYQHSMILFPAGQLYTWGNNSSGQLGTGGTTQSLQPTAVNTASGSALYGTTVSSIASGAYFSLALCSNGTLAEWGDESYAEPFASSNTTSTPTAVSTSTLATGEKYFLVASGPSAYHALALVAEPLHLPTMVVTQASSVPLASGSSRVNFGGVAAGGSTTQIFTITNNGTANLVINGVTITGTNAADYSVTTAPSTPVPVNGSTTLVVTFQPGGAGNRSATLNIACNDPINAAFNVALLGAESIALNANYTSAATVPLTANNFIASGSTVAFTLGYAPTVGTTLMVVQNTGSNFVYGTFINLAQGQSVTLTYNGISYAFVANYYGGNGFDLVLQWANVFPAAWGNDTYGQLGNADTKDASQKTPVAVVTTGVLQGKTLTQVCAGAGHSLGLCVDGTLVAWGDNGNGQLGTNNSGVNSNVPVAVDVSAADGSALAGKKVVAIAVGAYHSLALCSDGTVAAWGWNVRGQLGNNSTTDSGIPVLVNSSSGISALYGKTVIALAGGYEHSLALCSDGTVYAWGDDSAGELGNNVSAGAQLVPVTVNTAAGVSALNGQTVTAISAGSGYSVALTSAGSVVSWGDDTYGELGTTNTPVLGLSAVPITVNVSARSALAGQQVVAIAAGWQHCLALTSTGAVVAWGDDTFGELGNNSNTSSAIPVAVNTTTALAGQTVTSIAAGQYISMAYCAGGMVAEWGSNTSGIGNSSVTATGTPLAISTTLLTGGDVFLSATTGSAALHGLALVAQPPSPQIDVQQPTGTALASGTSTLNFGTINAGTNSTLTMAITNVGAATLNITSIMITGANAADFSIVGTPSTSLAVQASTSFSLSFSPTLLTAETATLQIVSNDPLNPTFTVALTGTGNVPRIDPQQTLGTSLVNGSTVVGFGQVVDGANSSITITVSNSGNLTLNILGVSVSGTNASDFTITAKPQSQVAQYSETTFTIQYSPSVAGAESASVLISSNDPVNGAFVIPVSGTGITSYQSWEQTNFGSTSNTGSGAETATPQNDGVPNLLKFATAMDPTVPGIMPGAVTNSGGNLVFTYTRNKAAMSQGLTFSVQWSDTLAAGSWSTANVTETYVDNGATQTVTDTLPQGPNGCRFVQLVVTGP